MPSRGITALAFALAGLTTGYAIPVTLLPRVPSSAAYAAPSVSLPGSVVPSAAGSTASVSLPGSVVPSATGSTASVSLPGSVVPSATPSAAPSVSEPVSAPVYSTVPSVLPGTTQPPADSTPPTTTTTPPPTTPTPTPTPTWSIVLEIGESQFNIGDADPSGFEDLWKGACGANGCDGGTPQTFDYNGISGGIETQMTGQFVMSGNIDNNQDWTNDLLDTMNAAFQKSIQCSQETAEQCSLKRDANPETPGVASDCSWPQITQCTMVNYIQATMYDDQSNQKAQITMNGSSEPDSAFPCDTFFGIINGAATAVEVAPPVAGALAIIQVICDIATGS